MNIPVKICHMTPSVKMHYNGLKTEMLVRELWKVLVSKELKVAELT